MKRISLYSALLALFLFSTCEPTGKVEFIILQLNDVYEIAPIEGGKAGGMARVATVRKELLAENPNVITVHAGDFVSPSLIGTLTYENEKIAGKHMVEVMNALEIDYVVPGNHEYDIKEDEHLKRIAESEFLWMTTNCFHRVNGELLPWEQNGQPFPDHFMHRINGVDIAFFGPTVPFTVKDYVGYTDVYESTIATYEKVKDEAEVLVGLTHLEEYMDSTLATKIPELDLILGGHDHTNMKHQYGSTIMTKADANAKTVYIHRMSYDKATGKTTITSELKRIDDKIADDPAVKKIVDKWVGIANQSMASMGYSADEHVMTTSDTLDGRESSIRHRPTNYPIMTAESFLFVAPQADLAVFNSGSIRLDDQLTGTITEYDILRSFPFGGGIALVDLKGEVIEQILETGTVTNVGIGGYLQLANAEKKADGWYIKGKKLLKSKTYKLALPEFVMGGGESNLGFIGDYKDQAQEPESFGDIKNDVRNIIMAYMRQL